MNWIRSLLSADDGVADSAVLCVMLLVVGYLTFGGISVITGKPFDWQAYGIGGATLIGTFTIAKGVREKLSTPTTVTTAAITTDASGATTAATTQTGG